MREFKRLVRTYIDNHAPPSADEMRLLDRRRGKYGWLDILQWQDEIGLRRGPTSQRRTYLSTALNLAIPRKGPNFYTYYVWAKKWAIRGLKSLSKNSAQKGQKQEIL